MRLIKLALSGWGPYASCEAIDFGSFGKEGIFLISGATGGGKTTIFDGITYALYGETSTAAREKDFLRSDFAKPDTDTFVELIFSHKGKEYKVVRSPKYSRPKKRGKGETVSNETAVLYEEGKVPVTALKEVNQKLVTIIGISYKQFKQIAMIAQGEFLELLLANSKDRVEIFRDLFGTGEQERFQKKLVEKAKEAFGALAENRHRMEEILSQIKTDREDVREEVGSEYRNYKRLTELVIEEMKEDREEIAVLTKKIEEKEKKKKKLEEKNREYVNLQKRLLEQEKKVAVCQKEKEESEKKKEQAVWQAKKEQEDFFRQRKELEVQRTEQKEKIEELEEEIRRFGGLEEQLSKARLSLANVENEIERHQDLKRKESQLEDQQKLLSKAQEEYKKAEAGCDAVKQEYEAKDRSFRAAAIGLAAQYLEPGKPCPVCGSLEHPNPAALSKGVPDEKEVKSWKKKWQKAEEEKNQVFNQASQIKGSLEAMRREFLAALEKAAIEEEKLNEAIQALDLREREESQRVKRLENQLEEKKKLQGEKEKKEKEQSLSWEKKEQAERLYERQREKTKKEEEKQKLLAESKRVLLEELEKEKQKLEKEVLRCRERLLKGADGIDAALLQQELANLEKERKGLLAEKEAKLVKSTVNKTALDSIEEKQQERQGLQENYSLIKGLEQASSGKNKERMVFEQYVLSAYFEDIVAAANLRLDRMTGGRYQLSRVERVLDGRTTDSLNLEVLDNFTGKKRPVRTLSGGESFKAALSLALGLSDMVQNFAGGIQMETLFIDEGFGALDEESLEQAMETLEMLTEHNRLIGIISHVPQLKERIQKQITVEKGRNGSHIV